ncbi:MAG: glutathione S-transferase [Alphaproteobacteria bacterium]|nr:glutathione S-transferase [Alphaproteobacteria bacterium]
MKLRFTFNPNYIHKVLVVAHEAGLADQIRYVLTGPFDAASDLGHDNPLGKVPTLVLDDGEAIFGGPIICEYLDWLNPGRKLFPPAGPARFRTLTQMMIGEGIFDALVLLDIEGWRPGPERRADYAARQWDKVVRSLDKLERDAAGFAPDLDVGQICIAGGLSRVDYRLKPLAEAHATISADFAWRATRPTLAAWYDALIERPSFRFTVDKSGTPRPPSS